MAKSTRVALENDYEIVLQGLRAILRPYEPGIRVVEVEIERPPRRHADVTLLDTYGEAEDAEHRVHNLLADRAAGKIVVFSFSDQQPVIRRVLKAGATGFISKAVSATQLVDGIRAAARGERVIVNRQSQRAAIDARLRWPGRDLGLTERESELLALLPTGMTNEELGRHLYVSHNTIKTQLRSLYAKLGVHNRTQAATVGQDLLGRH
jgi:NarL family two-component system response regulator LiaR